MNTTEDDDIDREWQQLQRTPGSERPVPEMTIEELHPIDIRD